MIHHASKRPLLGALVFASGLLAACSSGGGGGSSGSSSGGSGFQLESLNLNNGAIWHINRPIEFTFNAEVDFTSVSLNTINLRTPAGTPATGAFFFKRLDLDGDGVGETEDRTKIVFQPTCPTLEDLSDSGLEPGGTRYDIVVVGTTSGTNNTVRSSLGQRLQNTQTRFFTTPASSDPEDSFIDLVSGPPTPVVRAIGSEDLFASYLELGEDDSNRVYFEFDVATQTYQTDPPGFELPLNLYSNVDSHVAVIVEFNQPISPDSVNVSEERIRLEFQDGFGTWIPIDTRVEIVTNCSITGATVRLEPVGILPAGAQVRAAVLAGFQDLAGQANSLTIDNFAVTPTEITSFGSLSPATDLADEFREEFDLGSEDIRSFQDEDALFDSPAAVWGDGMLTSSFAFTGSGGPDGDFDWIIRTGENVFFDTTATTIIGGPGGLPTNQQNTVGGIVDVRDFIIEEGGTVRVQGPNPFVVNASRDIIIRGTLNCSGFNSKDVATLNTGNQTEIGAPGVGGGGRGGSANLITTNSSPKGGQGEGAYGSDGLGGLGGESAFTSSTSVNNRRPGGGGGGSLTLTPVAFEEGGGGAGTDDPVDVTSQPGDDGTASAGGAVDGSPPDGGFAGPTPFLDATSTNDFFGVRPVVTGGVLTGLIRGELDRIWAGSGGGGGGNACTGATFPTPNWNPGSDEKGGGGGGGGGAVNLRALGRIIFGASGSLLSNGGQGAFGENTNFLDHIGGSGGGGSAGHVVLESASFIDFTDNNPNAPERWYICAVGGKGANGLLDGGGGYDNVSQGNGGDGGAGIIQLHVPDPVTPPGFQVGSSDIVVPLNSFFDSLGALTEMSAPVSMPMIPTFAARSQGRSKWISIGGADQNPKGGEDLVAFLFSGTQTTAGADQGKVLTTSGTVTELDALLGPEAIGGNVSLDPDGVTISISGSSLDPLRNDAGIPSDDLYLRTPDLLENFVLRLAVVANPLIKQDFPVSSASYDDVSVVLSLTVDSSTSGTLEEFVASQPGQAIQYELIPVFFRVRTDNVVDELPDTAFVRITFQATGSDADGNPDEDNLLVDWTGDIAELNALSPGALQFFRFQVEFDLDAQSTGLSTESKPVALDFLRLPFRF